jgi:hypothetical protein
MPVGGRWSPVVTPAIVTAAVLVLVLGHVGEPTTAVRPAVLAIGTLRLAQHQSAVGQAAVGRLQAGTF